MEYLVELLSEQSIEVDVDERQRDDKEEEGEADEDQLVETIQIHPGCVTTGHLNERIRREVIHVNLTTKARKMARRTNMWGIEIVRETTA